MKALKINVVTREIEEITIGDFRTIAPAIGNGCDLFCCPYSFHNLDTMYLDDEILLRANDIMGGFSLRSWDAPLVNSAVVIGSTYDGESCDVKMTADELRKIVVFHTKEDMNEYAQSIGF